MATQINLLAAALALTGTLYYVFIYTMLLKRRTHHNVTIGGVAGAIPALVGWAAANSISVSRPGCCFSSFSYGRRLTPGL